MVTNPNSEDGGNDDSACNGSISGTLTDPRMFDCCICLEPLRIPVFHCENGYTACCFCRLKPGEKWPRCSSNYSSCLAIEKVLESLTFSCPYKNELQHEDDTQS